MSCFLEEITKWIDEGSPVDIIYLDFQKVFDKAPHERLLPKLKAHGISDGIIDWIDLTRFAIQAKGPDGKWTRKPLAYRESNNIHLLIARPPEICVNLVFKHIHAASSYTICRQFVPFMYCPL